MKHLLDTAVRRLHRCERGMVALEYVAILVALIIPVTYAFSIIGAGAIEHVKTVIQQELTFTNIPDDDLSGSPIGEGTQLPPGEG